MKKKITLLFMLVCSIVNAQLKGLVTNYKGVPLPNVNIYIKNSYKSTTTNDKGMYEFKNLTEAKVVVVFQYMGYKTYKEEVTLDNTLKTLNVTLNYDSFELKEVVIKKGENLANEIIKNAIAERKANSKKFNRFTADFYSRGIFKVKELPKKFMGQDIDMFDEIIDSTRSGILYLSETVSKITCEKPNKLKEVIVASKVSGNDKGYSFNKAGDADFDFYENYIPLSTNAVSPIADNAFNYYKYKLEGSTVEENGQSINKIKVTPKRNSEPAFTGYIYIADDSYAIYAVDLEITGKQIASDGLNTLKIKQNFSYNPSSKIWTKNLQTLDFDAGILVFKFNGSFTHSYSNYTFPESFDKKTFTSEIVKFETNANKKEDNFWQNIRPVPLTEEESNDYIKKNTLQEKRKSEKYLDSIDAKHNKFKLGDILSGYTYSKSFKKWSISYNTPITSISYNTVQGWKVQPGINYYKYNDENKTYTSIYTKVDYGFSEHKWRIFGGYTQKLSNFNHSYISIFAGSKTEQINPNNPISSLVNMVSTMYFTNNFMKLYEKNSVQIKYGRELANGLYLNASAEYAEKKPLLNTTDHKFTKTQDLYTSNNPLLPEDFTSVPFEKFNFFKTGIETTITFKQQYVSRPDGKYNQGNDAYPKLFLGIDNGWASTNKNNNYTLAKARVAYTIDLGNKGELKLNTRIGKFFNADAISFTEYAHFNGNQTHVSGGLAYTNQFNLLPYYSMSTNKSYFETHIELHNGGYILNKLPLINKLQSKLVLGVHNLSIPNSAPYQEFSVGLDNLGFGKIKLFRLDYFRAYQSGYQGDGILIGFKMLNAFE